MLKGLLNKILRVEETPTSQDEIEARTQEDLSQELEVTINAIKASGIVGEITSILSGIDFDYEDLNEKINHIRANLIADQFVSTIRVIRWDGKVMIQKGTVISKNREIISIDTMTGEYGIEIVLSLKPKEEYKFKLLWIGLDYAGKTTLLHKLRYNEFIAPKRTVGQELEDVVVEGLKITNIDLGGQKALRPHWSKFPLVPQVIVYVIDILDEDRYKEAYEELKNQIVSNERFEDIPLILAINKIDEYKSDKEPVAYITEKIDFMELLGDRSWQIQVVSALTGEGLDQFVDTLTKILLDIETR